MDLTRYIRDVPDFPKPGILFKDITPLLADPAALRHAVERMADHYRGRPLDLVAAVEARGFLFAAPLALLLQKPLVPLRKPGKLPYRTHSLQYELEYGSLPSCRCTSTPSNPTPGPCWSMTCWRPAAPCGPAAS
jgi:adenine phosphoribosyltransferase